MSWDIGENVVAQGNGQAGQRRDTGESKVFPLSFVIALGGSVEAGSEVEDNPVTALAQPPALQFSSCYSEVFTVRTACLPW